MTVSTNIPKPARSRQRTAASELSDRRFQIANDALGKLYTCRAMADIICFENEMPDSLDEQTVTTLKFYLWELIGNVETLIDCAEFKS